MEKLEWHFRMLIILKIKIKSNMIKLNNVPENDEFINWHETLHENLRENLYGYTDYKIENIN